MSTTNAGCRLINLVRPFESVTLVAINVSIVFERTRRRVSELRDYFGGVSHLFYTECSETVH